MKRIALIALLTMFCLPAFADEDTWTALTKQQQDDLQQQLAPLPVQSVYILCNDAECEPLAKSLKHVFKAVNWQVTKDRFPYSRFKKGFSLWAASDQLRLVGNMIQRSANNSFKVQPLKDDLLDEKLAQVVITIGEK